MHHFSYSRRIAVAMISIAFATGLSEAATMQKNSVNLVRLLKLPDPAFFLLDEDRQSELMHQIIVMDDFEGSVIACPSVVDVAGHDSVPLLWASRLTNLRQWKVVTRRNSTLVVSDLNNGKVTLHDAFAGPKRLNYQNIPKSAQGSEAGVKSPDGASANIRVLDLASVANLPARPGRYALTLLTHDWASNTVRLELVRKGRAGNGDAEETLPVRQSEMLVLHEKVKGMALAKAPAISFVKSGLTPSLPGPGIALALPAAQADTPRALVHGAARLTLAPGNMVAGGTSGAVVRLAVLVARIDNPVPLTIALEVPLAAGAAPKAGAEVSLAFHVDIEAALRTRLEPATYQIYVVGNEHVAGPYPLQIAPSGAP
jgi:hypothetical protein